MTGLVKAVFVGLLAVWFLCLFTLHQANATGIDPDDLPPALMNVLYQAQQALEKGDLSRAERLLSRFLKHSKGKGTYLVYHLLGNVYYQENELQKAYGAYAKGLENEPGFLPLVSNLAAVSYSLQKYEEASRLFYRAYELSEKPKEPDLLYNAAAAAYFASDFRRAEKILLDLVHTYDASLRSSWCVLTAQVLIELDELGDAERLLLGFTEKIPDDPSLWKLLSQVRLLRRDYVKAALALEVAFSLEPPGKEGWEQLSAIYNYAQDPLRAAQCLEKAYGDAPSAEESERLSRLYLQAHRLDESIFYLNRAIETEPTGERYLLYGQILYDHNLVDRAEKAFQKALAMGVEDKGLLNLLLGLCALERGEFHKAKTALHFALGFEKYKSQARVALSIAEDMAE